MNRLSHRVGTFAPLALGAALAAHGAADAKSPTYGEARMVGPEPVVGLTAEHARDRGRMLLAANNVVDALQAYRQALAQDPDSIDSLNGVAVCYDRLGRYEDSRLHYEAALGIDPTSPMLLNNYGLSLFLQGDLAEAARFLRLAAAAGDPQVQAASLRILAKIDQREAATQSHVQTARPVPTVVADAGPQVVRTSDHELRLVLDKPRAPAVVQLAVADRPADEAVAIAAVGDFTPGEEARIARVEAIAVAAEYAAAARADAQARVEAMADALPPVPSEMLVAAWLEAARRPDPSEQPVPPLLPAAPMAISPAPAAPDWHHDRILVMAPNSQRPDKERFDRTGLRMALLAAGFAPPRPSQRAHLAAAARAALEPDATRRSFPQPFQSDNCRLNGLAQRIHGLPVEDEVPDIAEQVARLEALIARVQAA